MECININHLENSTLKIVYIICNSFIIPILSTVQVPWVQRYFELGYNWRRARTNWFTCVNNHLKKQYKQVLRQWKDTLKIALSVELQQSIPWWITPQRRTDEYRKISCPLGRWKGEDRLIKYVSQKVRDKVGLEREKHMDCNVLRLNNISTGSASSCYKFTCFCNPNTSEKTLKQSNIWYSLLPWKSRNEENPTRFSNFKCYFLFNANCAKDTNSILCSKSYINPTLNNSIWDKSKAEHHVPSKLIKITEHSSDYS